MQLLLTASKDTYITDKIINSTFSASDANVGMAGTLDLFRLANESFLSGVNPTNELSRILLKFDYDQIIQQSKAQINLNDLSSYKIELELTSIGSAHTTPIDFTTICFPLSQSFDEGIGRDVISFADIDVTNFLTASVGTGGTVAKWNMSGANAEGVIDATAGNGYPDNIDIISSGNLNDGQGTVALGVSQRFVKGTENLRVDVTKIVSATIANILPDSGFRISFSGSQEQDSVTRFVKRFASRHHSDPLKRPKLRVSYSDTIIDNHLNFNFDISGSLFLKNYHRGQPFDILSGSSLTAVTGTNCMLLKLESGSFSQVVSCSQVPRGTPVPHAGGTDAISFQTGCYIAQFAVSASSDRVSIVVGADTIHDFYTNSGSIKFDEIWGSLDGSVGYYTGSLKVTKIPISSFSIDPKDISLIVTNARSSYLSTESPLVRVFVNDLADERFATKLPIRKSSIGLEKVYYRIKDTRSGEVIIPFTKALDATRLSQDSGGLYFKFSAASLPRGRTYTFDFLVEDAGIEKSYPASNVIFTVK